MAPIPDAVFSVDKTQGNISDTSPSIQITFTNTTNLYIDNYYVMYWWFEGDGSIIKNIDQVDVNLVRASLGTTLHTYTVPGTYQPTLLVVYPQTGNVVSQTSIPIYITHDNTPDVTNQPDFINIVADSLSIEKGEVVNFDASVKRLTNSKVTRWVFGDKSTPQVDSGKLQASHQYTGIGQFLITLTSYAEAEPGYTGQIYTINGNPNLKINCESNTLAINVLPPGSGVVPSTKPSKLQAAGHSFAFTVIDNVIPPPGSGNNQIVLNVEVQSMGSNIAPNAKKTFKIYVNKITNVKKV